MAATVVLGVGNVGLSLTNEDADAAKRPHLKTLWAVVMRMAPRSLKRRDG
jgi:hypothetical protein